MAVRGTFQFAALGLAFLFLVPAIPARPDAPLISPLVSDAVGPGTLESVPGSLTDLVRAWDARLGVERDAADLQVLAQLDPELASAAARLLGALLAAAEIRDEVFQGVPNDEILSRADDLDGPLVADPAPMRAAAAGLAQIVDEVMPVLRSYADSLPPTSLPAAAPPLVNLPPVLVLDPLGVSNDYTDDAVLALDAGGADLYDMNAGGSIIGIIHTADPATCFVNAGGLVSVGCEYHDAIVSITASLAIDLGGNDRYGVRKSPQFTDANCQTSTPIIRRIVMQGAGSGGIGMLVDVAGDDVYDAKTLSQGHGHISGVGVLVDVAGNDAYTAIRSSQGSGVLGGAGVFADLGGHDTHVFAAPAGGIFNVDSGACDATARLGLGAAAVAATGYFYEHDGDDSYKIAPIGLGEATLGHGVFVDRAGTDNYNGYAGRGNGVRSVNSGGLGLFVDV